jgi:hypothetical protein
LGRVGFARQRTFEALDVPPQNKPPHDDPHKSQKNDAHKSQKTVISRFVAL